MKNFLSDLFYSGDLKLFLPDSPIRVPKRMVFPAALSLSSVNAQVTDNAIQYCQLPMEVYKDKVAGGWL